MVVLKKIIQLKLESKKYYEEIFFYFNRTAGYDRHYRDFGRDVVARAK